MTKWIELLNSRKFIVAIATAVCVVLNKKLGWDIDETTVTNVCITIAGFIVSHGVVDAAKAHGAELAAGAEAASYNEAQK